MRIGERSAVLVVWFVAVACTAVASAAPEPPADRTDRALGRYHVSSALEKLGRGLSNVVGGPLEIPLNIDKRYTSHDILGSSVTGLGLGLVKGVVRTGVGLYETVTFFLPIPSDYAPILPTLEYFDRTTKRKPLPLE